jgi:hypothetical protein
VLILEDDCAFRPDFLTVLTAALARDDWEICYPGWEIHYPGRAGRELPHVSRLFACDPDDRFRGAHCYLVRNRTIRGLPKYLEGQHLRGPDDPLGGPMSPDAALNWYRRIYEVPTLVATPPVAVQRPSRSDLSPKPWDRVPGLRWLAAAVRRLRSASASGWPHEELDRRPIGPDLNLT